jgi:hypothetical protein
MKLLADQTQGVVKMNRKNMPGFTAEVSLSGVSEHYQMLGSSSAQAAGGVLAQFCHTNLEGRITECCYCYQGSCWCQPVKRITLFPTE